MPKSGKFDLFFFSTEGEFILYCSKNRVKKYIAFNVIETDNLEKLIPLFNSNLEVGILNYYSIQIVNFSLNKIFIVLSFQDKIKENLLKSIYIFKEAIEKYSAKEFISIKYFKKKELKDIFTDIISEKINEDIKVICENYLSYIKNKEIIHYFKTYSLNFVKENYSSSIFNIFFNLINDLGIKGRLIINFRLKKGNIVFNSYFIEYFYNLQEHNSLVQKVDEFIADNLEIKEERIKDKIIGKLLWRLNLTNECLPYKKNADLVISLCRLVQNKDEPSLTRERFKELRDSPVHDVLIKYFEKKKINFKKISSNIFELNAQYIILLIYNYNPNLIRETFLKYYPNRKIFLIIEDKSFQKRLMTETKIDNLLGVKIFNSKSFLSLLKKGKIFKLY